MTPMPSVFSEAFLNAGFNPTLIELTKFWLGYDYESQLLAGAEFFTRAISCTQATQSDTINSIASAG